MIIFSQVGGKIELSTKTKASTAGAADDNTKTQIGRLTKTVSSSGKVEISMVSYSRTRRIDKSPRFSIRIDIWILLSDTETSAATPPGVMQKKWSLFKLT